MTGINKHMQAHDNLNQEDSRHMIWISKEMHNYNKSNTGFHTMGINQESVSMYHYSSIINTLVFHPAHLGLLSDP